MGFRREQRRRAAHRPWARALAVTVLTATVVAACGGSDDDGGGDAGGAAGGGGQDSKYIEVGPTSGPDSGWSNGGLVVDPADLQCGEPAENPTRGITDTSVKVGGLAYLTSPNGSTMAGTEVGAKVRFDRANEEGGVHGRTIDFIGVRDDGADPGRNGQEGRALAEQEQIFAAVPVMTNAANYLDSFCEEKVPFFGWGINTAFCDTAIGFGITGCQLVTSGIVTNSVGHTVTSLFEGEEGPFTIAFIGNDNDASRAGLERLRQGAEASGLEVVYAEAPIPVSGAVDVTAVVNDIMTSADGGPPDVVYHVEDTASVLRLVPALTSAGYPGKQISPLYDPRLAGLADLDGTYQNVQWMPAEDTDNEAIEQMRADFAKYAPDQVLSLAAMAGYWSADFFVKAITEVGRDLTVDALVDLINGGYTNHVPGALPETRWPDNHVSSVPCSAVLQLKDGKFHTVAELSCGSLLVPRS
ncbi:MAG: ABC transporter substrate-binding protein [Frankia sp.]|nr:ABC transporter substrate-binding protein [Frankia sp.]